MSAKCAGFGCDARARYAISHARESDKWGDQFIRTRFHAHACGRHLSFFLSDQPAQSTFLVEVLP